MLHSCQMYLIKTDGKKIVYIEEVRVQKNAILTYFWISSQN